MTTYAINTEENAMNDFMANIAQAMDYANRIDEHIDAHMGVNPDAMNYAHVGDAARLAAMLREVCETFNI